MTSAPGSQSAPAVAQGVADRRDAAAVARLRSASPWLPVILAALSLAGALALAISPATGRQVDFEVYRMGGAQILGQRLYDVYLAGFNLHFTYPPFAALLFWPFAQVSVRLGQVVWLVVNLAALVALTAVSIRAVRPDWPRARIWGVALIALFPVLRLSPDILTLDYGQVNFVVALLVLVDLTVVVRLGSRTLPRGVLLGIAAAIKLTPLIFIPFLVLTRQFRAAATALCSFLVCSAAALAVSPHSSAFYWSQKIFERAASLIYISDQNLHSALQRMIGAQPAPVLVDGLSILFIVGGLAVATWAYRSSSPMLGILLCAATGLIVSPVSWAHHYVWVVPVLAWLVLGTDRPRGGRWWALAVAILFWVAPIWWVPDVQQGYGGPLVLLAGNSFFLAAVAFLLLAALLLWSRRRSYPASSFLGSGCQSG
ncbi:MAG TPA: glycosyltransferase 87 family protein [Streptosporangiaceae bacterium]|nr:glycosyltransferase 87 family protein [Streptosporangiaceae bacterium]